MHPSKTINFDSQEDRQLLVFRYVAGEMSADEVDAFESHLLEDEQLCDEVAEMVALTSDISVALAEPLQNSEMQVEKGPSSSQPLVESRRINWTMTLAIAAGFSLVAFVGGWLSHTQNTDRPNTTGDVASVGPLAEAWSQVVLPTGEVSLEEGTSEWVPEWSNEWEPAGDSIAAEVLEADSSDSEVPDWMAAAIMGLGASSDMESMEMNGDIAPEFPHGDES